MLALALIRWWYDAGWKRLLSQVEATLGRVYHYFSVPLLAATLFAPWKRITSYPGKSLQDRLRALIDNMVSRAVGLVVRSLVLLAACVSLAGIAIVGLVGLVVWPLVPLVAIALPVIGLVV